MRSLRTLGSALLLATLVVTPSLAQQGHRSDDWHPDDPRYRDIFEGADEEWKEDRTEFPKSPTDQDLLAFDVPGSPYTHYIDKNSLSFGKDEVVRYTVVVEAAGTRNVFYEGIRCETREYRSLGFATGQRPFRPRNGAVWRRMYGTDGGANQFRWVLWDRYMCDESGQWLAVDDIIRRLSGA